jgi:hypothetical protein
MSLRAFNYRKSHSNKKNKNKNNQAFLGLSGLVLKLWP